jgi:tripartite-type tricarboxylate transporter receptor subunit TctC
VPVVSVNADTDYEDFTRLLDALKTGDVGTAGINSSGGMALAALRDETDGELAGARMITYDGGNPAVIAAASGEVQATAQLAVEQAEMIHAGRLRALAVLSDKPLEIEGVDPIPPITESFPTFTPRKTTLGSSFLPARRRRPTIALTKSGRST